MAESVYLTNEQARRLCFETWTLGDYRYSGKQGVLEYICQAARMLVPYHPGMQNKFGASAANI